MIHMLLGYLFLFSGFLIPTLTAYYLWQRHTKQATFLKERLQQISKLRPQTQAVVTSSFIDKHHRRRSFEHQSNQHRNLLHMMEIKLKRAGFLRVHALQAFAGLGLVAAILTCALYVFLHSTIFIALPLGVGITGGLFYFICSSLELQRQRKILDLMPEALDIINRSIRAGLGVSRAIEVVSSEINDPLRSEFRFIADRLNVGQPLTKVLEEAAENVNTDDFRFFTISIMIQHETGGSLSEALTNLSQLIRKRHELRMKIKALSSEARASAMIVGSLPFLASLGLSILNPEHLQPFITNPKGHTLLMVAVGMMVMGILVIRRMIQFRV